MHASLAAGDFENSGSTSVYHKSICACFVLSVSPAGLASCLIISLILRLFKNKVNQLASLI